MEKVYVYLKDIWDTLVRARKDHCGIITLHARTHTVQSYDRVGEAGYKIAGFSFPLHIL